MHPGRAWPEKKDIPRLIICALTGIVFNQLLIIKGVSLTSPIHSALLSLATPLFITGIAAWLLRETFTFLKALGLLLGLSGAALLIMLKTTPGAMQNSLEGDTMVLLNAISYSFYLVLIKPLMAKYQGVDILRWLFLMGAIIILPIGVPLLIQTDYSTWSWVSVFKTSRISVSRFKFIVICKNMLLSKFYQESEIFFSHERSNSSFGFLENLNVREKQRI